MLSPGAKKASEGADLHHRKPLFTVIEFLPASHPVLADTLLYPLRGNFAYPLPLPKTPPELVQSPAYLCPVHAPPHSSPNALKAPSKACKYCILANKKQTLWRRFAAS